MAYQLGAGATVSQNRIYLPYVVDNARANVLAQAWVQYYSDQGAIRARRRWCKITAGWSERGTGRGDRLGYEPT